MKEERLKTIHLNDGLTVVHNDSDPATCHIRKGELFMAMVVSAKILEDTDFLNEYLPKKLAGAGG